MARGDTAKEIEKMKEDFKDLDLAIVEGAKQFKVLRDSISKTESILGSTNWVIFSRFISGTPLWRIQNRIKATVMLLNEISNSAEKRRTEEAKEIQNFAKIAKMKRKAVDIESRLLKIESLSGVEKQKAIDALKDASEQYEGLSLKLGSEQKAREKLLEIMEDRIRVTDKLEKKAMRASELADADFKTKMKHFSGLRAAQEAYNNFRTKTAEQMNQSEMAAEKTKLTTLQKMRLKMGGLDPSRMVGKDGNVKGPTQELDMSRGFASMFGKGRFRDARGQFASEKQYKLMQKMHKINKRNAAIRKRFIVKPLQKITKKVGEMALNMVKMVFYALAQFMKMVLVLIVLVAAFKLIEPFLGNIWKAITSMASVLYQGIMMIVEGVALMFTGVYNILAGILNLGQGGGEQILQGIAQLGMGLLDVLAGILVATVGTLLAGIATFVGSLFMDGFRELGGGIKGVISGVGNVFKGVSGVVAAIAMVVATIGLLIGATFALPALIVAGIALLIYMAVDPIVWALNKVVDFFGWIWGKISDFSFSDVVNDLIAGFQEAVAGIFDKIPKPSDAIKGAYGSAKSFLGLSTGGRIKEGGMALVGEKGPELVTLPKGAQVHSNSASKAIASSVTNHITVQVTGRVGASDTEIRDIANKVAREINTRMNRTSTSVVKF